ncbi:MAG TPA: FlgD immunoglobulin-like domain containing protein, partial [Acidimicrobiia bacterium]|nr:FlgD immunoglobulin-like domain containing protein [Acidimicrobiia bacterium]
GTAATTPNRLTGSIGARTDSDVKALSLCSGERVRAKLTAPNAAVIRTLSLYDPGASRGVIATRTPFASVTGASGFTLSTTVDRDGLWYLEVGGRPDLAGIGSAGSYTLDVTRPDPKITRLAVDRSRFSPNGDGVKDDVTISWRNAAKAPTVVQVFDHAGRLVFKKSLGRLTSGSHSYRWDGRRSGGRGPRDGSYTVRVLWDGACEFLAPGKTVVVDRARPSVRDMRASPGTVFPVNDDYRDSTKLRFTLGERAKVYAEIAPAGSSRIIRRVGPFTMDPGSRAITWNGKASDGSVAPAGRYDVRIRAVDAAGNTKRSSRFDVKVSHKRLVGKTKTFGQDAIAFYGGFLVGDCAEGRNSGSFWDEGMWLTVSDCDDGLEFVQVNYRFRAPDAVKYGGIRFRVYGYSFDSDPIFAVARDWTDGWEVVGGEDTDPEERWIAFDSFSSRGRVRSDGRFDVGVLLADLEFFNEFDYRRVEASIRYYVLE